MMQSGPTLEHSSLPTNGPHTMNWDAFQRVPPTPNQYDEFFNDFTPDTTTPDGSIVVEPSAGVETQRSLGYDMPSGRMSEFQPYDDASLDFYPVGSKWAAQSGREVAFDNGGNFGEHFHQHHHHTSRGQEAQVEEAPSNIHSARIAHYHPSNEASRPKSLLPKSLHSSQSEPLFHHHEQHHHYRRQPAMLQNGPWSHLPLGGERRGHPRPPPSPHYSANRPQPSSSSAQVQSRESGVSEGLSSLFRDSFHSSCSRKEIVSSAPSYTTSTSTTSGEGPAEVGATTPTTSLSPWLPCPRLEEEEAAMLIQEGRPLPPFLPTHASGRVGRQERAKGEREDQDNRGELAQALVSGFAITKGRREENETGKAKMSSSSSNYRPGPRAYFAAQPGGRGNTGRVGAGGGRRLGSPRTVTEKDLEDQADSVTSSCSSASGCSSSEDEEEEIDASVDLRHERRRLKELAMELLRARKRWDKQEKKQKKKQRQRRRRRHRTTRALENQARPSTSQRTAEDRRRAKKNEDEEEEEHVDDEVDLWANRLLSMVPERSQGREIEGMERIASDLLLGLNWEDAELGPDGNSKSDGEARKKRRRGDNTKKQPRKKRQDDDDNKTGNGNESGRPREETLLRVEEAESHHDGLATSAKEGSTTTRDSCCCNRASTRGSGTSSRNCSMARGTCVKCVTAEEEEGNRHVLVGGRKENITTSQLLCERDPGSEQGPSAGSTDPNRHINPSSVGSTDQALSPGCVDQTQSQGCLDSMEFTVFHHPQPPTSAATSVSSCDFVNFDPLFQPNFIGQHQFHASHGTQPSPQYQQAHVPIMFQSNLCVIQSGVSPGQCSTDSGYFGGGTTPQQFYSTDIVLNSGNNLSVPLGSQACSPTGPSSNEDPGIIDDIGSQPGSSMQYDESTDWTPPVDVNNDPSDSQRQQFASSSSVRSCDFLPSSHRFDESSCQSETTNCEETVPPSPGSTTALGSTPDDDLSQLMDQVLDSIEESSNSRVVLSSQTHPMSEVVPGSSFCCMTCGTFLPGPGQSCLQCGHNGTSFQPLDTARSGQQTQTDAPRLQMVPNQVGPSGTLISKEDVQPQHPPLVCEAQSHHQSHGLSSASLATPQGPLGQSKPKRSVGVVEPRVVVKLRVPINATKATSRGNHNHTPTLDKSMLLAGQLNPSSVLMMSGDESSDSLAGLTSPGKRRRKRLGISLKRGVPRSHDEMECGLNPMRNTKKSRKNGGPPESADMGVNRLSITKTLPEHFKRALEQRRKPTSGSSSNFQVQDQLSSGDECGINYRPSDSDSHGAKPCQVLLQKLDAKHYHHDDEIASTTDEETTTHSSVAFLQHSSSTDLPTFGELAAAFQGGNQKKSRRRRVPPRGLSAFTIASGEESEGGSKGAKARDASKSSDMSGGGSVARVEKVRILSPKNGNSSSIVASYAAPLSPNVPASLELPRSIHDDPVHSGVEVDKPKPIKITPTFCQLSLENVVFTKRSSKTNTHPPGSSKSNDNSVGPDWLSEVNVAPRKTLPIAPKKKRRSQGSSLSTKASEKASYISGVDQQREDTEEEGEGTRNDMNLTPPPKAMSRVEEVGDGMSSPGSNQDDARTCVQARNDYETLFSPIESLQGYDLAASEHTYQTHAGTGKSGRDSNPLDMPLLDELGQSHMNDWHDLVAKTAPQGQPDGPSSGDKARRSPEFLVTDSHGGYLRAVSPHKILSDPSSSSSAHVIKGTSSDGSDMNGVPVFSSQALLKKRREARTVAKSDMGTQATETASVASLTASQQPNVVIKMPAKTQSGSSKDTEPERKRPSRITFAAEPPNQWTYCDIGACKFWTQKTERMKRHKLCHTSGHYKNFKCPDCGLKFYSLPKMLKHDRRKHTGIKDYECRLCGAEVSDIGVHMRIHSEAESYKCKICSLEFRYRNSLVRHMCQHTGEQFRCLKCEMVYLTLEDLHAHLTAEHPEADELPDFTVHSVPSESEDERPMSPPKAPRPSVPTSSGPKPAPPPNKIAISRIPFTRRTTTKSRSTTAKVSSAFKTTMSGGGFPASALMTPQITTIPANSPYTFCSPTPVIMDCNGLVLQNLTWDGGHHSQFTPQQQQQQQQPSPFQYYQNINGTLTPQFQQQPQYFSIGNQIYATTPQPPPTPLEHLSDMLELPNEGISISARETPIKFEIIEPSSQPMGQLMSAVKENPVDIAMREIIDVGDDIQEIVPAPLMVDEDDDDIVILESPSMSSTLPLTASIKSEPVWVEEEVIRSGKEQSAPSSPPSSGLEEECETPIMEKSGSKLTIAGNSVQHQLESFSSKLKELRQGVSCPLLGDEKPEHSTPKKKIQEPIVEETKKQEYKCETCGRVYKYLEFLKVHQKRCS